MKHIKETLKSLHLAGAFLQLSFVHFSYCPETYNAISGFYCRHTASLGGADQWFISKPHGKTKNKVLFYCTFWSLQLFNLKLNCICMYLTCTGLARVSKLHSHKVQFMQHWYVFFSLKSTQTSLQTHIISEQNHNRVWNYPEAHTVCVLGLSRHLRALVHSEWLHAGPVPSLRITWIRIRFAKDIRHNEEHSYNKCFCSVGAFQSGVDRTCTQLSAERQTRH